MSKTIVLAIGGNSLIKDQSHISVQNQYQACVDTCKHIVKLIKQGHKLVITHGNGPQVGFILRRSELSKADLHEVPLDSCVADSQGAIGYNIQMALYNEMKAAGIKPSVVTLVTQVLVDKNDPSFKNPSKPIGTFMDKKTAKKREQNDGWNVVEDSGRGYRRVVPSPMPIEILEFEAIKNLLDSNMVVIAIGGGGIPVIRDDKGDLEGVEAVIDKDFASSLLAKKLNADLLVVSTAVEKVCINFGKPDEKGLSELTVSDAKKYMGENHFAKGSMLPKVEAVLDFVETSGGEGIITSPDSLDEALNGKAGTKVIS